jgi:hypothetical protein
MIWELGQGYRATLPAGERDPLLQAVKFAVNTPRFTSVQRSNNDVSLKFSTAWLATYRLLSSTDLNAGSWSTLTTNFNGNGDIMQFTDVGVLTNQARRFYRLQTPR